MQFIDLKQQYQLAKVAIDQQIQTVLTHGQYIMGPEVQQLEERLAAFVGVRHCVGLANGTVAIELALRALEIQPGDEVIMPVFSFMATAEIPALMGAIPVMIDIDPKTYNIDPSQIESAITSKTKAIIAVDMYGQCADYEAILAIADRHHIPVIEDAAQSFGASYKGKMACSLATIACTSFFPAKPLGCYGDGGACFTEDDELAARLCSLRNHGQTERYTHTRLGTNARLDTLQAAILLAKFDLFPKEIELRQQVASYYQEALKNFVPSLPYIEAYNQSIYAQYTIQVEDREVLRQQMDAFKIPTAVHYPKPMHQQPALAEYACSRQHFPVAERACQFVMSLPFWPYMSKEQVGAVAHALEQCVVVAE